MPDAGLVFDGHNDVLSKIFGADGLAAADKFIDGSDGAIDLVKAPRGGFSAGFFALFIPSPSDSDDTLEVIKEPAYDLPLPAPIEPPHAPAFFPFWMAQVRVANPCAWVLGSGPIDRAVSF